MNATEDEHGTVQSLSGFYAYKNTFDEDSVWLDIPKKGQNNCSSSQRVQLAE